MYVRLSYLYERTDTALLSTQTNEVSFKEWNFESLGTEQSCK